MINNSLINVNVLFDDCHHLRQELALSDHLTVCVSIALIDKKTNVSSRVRVSDSSSSPLADNLSRPSFSATQVSC
jgi:hypothetical protein